MDNEIVNFGRLPNSTNTNVNYSFGGSDFGSVGLGNNGFGNELSTNIPSFGGGGSNALDPASSAGGKGFQWFGKNGSLIPGLQALTGLFDAFTARKTLKAQKEAFTFNKGLATTNLANSASITNSQIEDSARSVGRQTGLKGDALDTYIANRVSERRVSGQV